MRPPSQTMPLVLLVDDCAENRELVAELLGLEAYRVAAARDGREALGKAVRLRPGVVLMDLALPHLDGWEATRRLKRHPRTRHIPVVAVSGFGPAEGPAPPPRWDGFVQKPYTRVELLDELHRVLASGRSA